MSLPLQGHRIGTPGRFACRRGLRSSNFETNFKFYEGKGCEEELEIVVIMVRLSRFHMLHSTLLARF